MQGDLLCYSKMKLELEHCEAIRVMTAQRVKGMKVSDRRMVREKCEIGEKKRV